MPQPRVFMTLQDEGQACVMTCGEDGREDEGWMSMVRTHSPNIHFSPTSFSRVRQQLKLLLCLASCVILKNHPTFLDLSFFICNTRFLAHHAAFILFIDRVSRSPGWLRTHAVARDNPKFLILLPLTPKWWDYR